MPAVPARRSRRDRSAHRRLPSPAPPRQAPALAITLTPHAVLLAVWIATVAAFLWYTMAAIGAKITWYLAVDQFGYLTFSHDLLHGHVFHHWPPIDALASRLPEQVDALSQTYVYDHGRLYCRYAPGFAILLAGWLALFGDDGAAYLNPTVYLALLVLTLAFQVRLFRSRWRALVGLALVVLAPTNLYLWSLTLVRDLPTHLSALLGLYLLLPARGRKLAPGRAAAAGLALGWACSIRPDAILYLVSAALLTAARWWRERPGLAPVLRIACAGALGIVIGLGPFLTYNWIARGNPLRPTQGMEFENPPPPPPAGEAAPTSDARPPADESRLARVGFPSGAWVGGFVVPVQGGGLRLSNLPRVLPGNIQFMRLAYGGVLLGLALCGVILALVRRRLLFLAAVPYSVLALLFFSCWARPDERYFCGVFLFVPMLVVEGIFAVPDLVRVLWRTGRQVPARIVAATFGILMLGAAFLVPIPRSGALPTVLWILPPIAAATALAAAVWPGVRVARWAAPALALALVAVACTRAADAAKSRARFQRPEMVRARNTFARAVEPGAVVITIEDIGRPGENIEYYSHVAHALYLTDLMRWSMRVEDAADLLTAAGSKPYLLIPENLPGRERMLTKLGQRLRVDLVKDIPAKEAMDYFVAARFHLGLRLFLYRLLPRDPVAPAVPVPSAAP